MHGNPIVWWMIGAACAVSLCADVSANYKAKNVFIVIADQFRFDDSWGDKNRAYIPRISKELTPKGSRVETFYGNPSFMAQVHLTILTGSWNDVRRIDPKTHPTQPTLFEVYRKKLGKPKEATYFITSKREYYYLEHSEHEEYGAEYGPVFEVTKEEGNDQELMQRLRDRMKTHQPSLVVVLLGQMKSYNKKRNEKEMATYRQQMRAVDTMLADLWQVIQSSPPYKDATDLFFVNDHGDLITHEDCDDECKRYMVMFAIGPDIREDYVSTQKWRQNNIAPTALKILGVNGWKEADIMKDFLVTAADEKKKK